MAESIITSASPQTAFARPRGDTSNDYWPSQVTLNVRGRRFVLDRETLNHLPDSLLSTMFPNGLIPGSRGYGGYGYGAGEYPYYRGGNDDASEQSWVDFDPDMLEYILRTYSEALEYDLLAPNQAARQNTGAQATGHALGNSSDDLSGNNNNNNNNNEDEGEDDNNSEDDEEAIDGADVPVWLSYSSSGKADVSGSASANASANESSRQAGSHAEPSKDPSGSHAEDGHGDGVPNDSISTFTDTGSHVNSSSGATQSTSSSAVLNYMRFVAGTASQGNEQTQAADSSESPPDAGVVYYDRSPLVVLREELDYFVVPSSGKTSGDISDVPGFTLPMAKTRCGELLVEDDSVFEPLERTMQRNLEKWRNKVHAEGVSDEAQALQSASIIEQQLIDMLCLAGFPRDARWGCRRTEPSKTSVTSILAVPLDESTDQSRMIAAQKLLLFYKKPARKCWWEGEDVNAGDNEHKIELKLWCRRTWTLELVLI